MTTKRRLRVVFIFIIAFVLGRLAIRGLLNFLVGGTLFGGNIL